MKFSREPKASAVALAFGSRLNEELSVRPQQIV